MRAAGLPPLDLMEGFYGEEYRYPIFWARKGLSNEQAFQDMRQCLPIKWSCLKTDPIHILLNHSDCEGEIAWQDCGPIAESLEKLLPLMPNDKDPGHIGDWQETTKKFINGLRLAASKKENVEFH